MKTQIVKYNGRWRVQFTHGVQTFRLEEYADTKKEAQWQERMLKNCFKDYAKSISSPITK